MERKKYSLKIHRLSNPCVAVIDDFLPEDVCDELVQDIENGPGEWTRATVVGDKGSSEEHHARTNWSKGLGYQSVAARKFLQYASKLVNLHPAQAESLSCIKYEIGQKYDAHEDNFTDLENHNPEAGNRVATVLLYLTDVKEGGETDFPDLNIRVSPKKGRVIYFETSHKGTEQGLKLSRHAAMPVIRGEKIAVNLWFRKGIYDNDLYQKIEEKIKNDYK